MNVEFNQALARTSAVNADGSIREPKKVLEAEDFFKLLSVQLANQNPMSPMEDLDFISQMSNFTSLEQMKNLSNSFNEFMGAQEQMSAQGYLGKEVSILSADGSQISGVVTSVKGVTEDEKGALKTMLEINGSLYDVSGVREVRNPVEG